MTFTKTCWKCSVQFTTRRARAEACSRPCRKTRPTPSDEKKAATGVKLRASLAARSPEAKALQVQRRKETIASNGQFEKLRERKLDYWAKFSAEQRLEMLRPAHATIDIERTREMGSRPKTCEQVAKQRVSLKKRYRENPELLQAMAERAGDWWASRRAQGLSGYTAKRTNSCLESTVRTILDALGVDYVEQRRLIGYWPDFLIPAKNLIIECDGKYWHEMPGRAEHDALRDSRLRGLGFTVVRLSEESINSDAQSAVDAALALVA